MLLLCYQARTCEQLSGIAPEGNRETLPVCIDKRPNAPEGGSVFADNVGLG